KRLGVISSYTISQEKFQRQFNRLWCRWITYGLLCILKERHRLSFIQTHLHDASQTDTNLRSLNRRDYRIVGFKLSQCRIAISAVLKNAKLFPELRPTISGERCDRQKRMKTIRPKSNNHAIGFSCNPVGWRTRFSQPDVENNNKSA